MKNATKGIYLYNVSLEQVKTNKRNFYEIFFKIKQFCIKICMLQNAPDLLHYWNILSNMLLAVFCTSVVHAQSIL